MTSKITAKDIERAISVRHAQDVVVHQCKTGASYGGELGIIDSWVMPRSWAHPDCTAYEIKVSRSDFLSDRKWHKYLDYCNYFYFVCPWKMIQPTEVPHGAGLVWLSQTGTKLFTKIKAPHRDVKIPESLFRYVLMGRTEVTRERSADSKKAYWEGWLEDKKLDHTFGYKVSEAIQERIRTEITEVRSKQHKLEQDIDRYKWVETYLSELGVSVRDGMYTWSFQDKVKEKMAEVRTGISQELMECLKQHKISIDKTIEILGKQGD